MKNSQAYSLDELKEGRYKPLELGEAGYLIPALRAAKFSALDLRKALIFNVQMMRDAGYTAPEMKKARAPAQSHHHTRRRRCAEPRAHPVRRGAPLQRLHCGCRRRGTTPGRTTQGALPRTVEHRVL